MDDVTTKLIKSLVNCDDVTKLKVYLHAILLLPNPNEVTDNDRVELFKRVKACIDTTCLANILYDLTQEK